MSLSETFLSDLEEVAKRVDEQVLSEKTLATSLGECLHKLSDLGVWYRGQRLHPQWGQSWRHILHLKVHLRSHSKQVPRLLVMLSRN